MARRSESLAALQTILGQTRSPGASARFGPPFFLGYLTSFLGFQSGAQVTPEDVTWEAWQKRTGELPPDFVRMPTMAEIPDPLVRLQNGRSTRITTRAEWAEQRKVIRDQLEYWVLGKMPPAPTNLRAVVTDTRMEGDVEVRYVRLEFGPDHKATLRLQLLIPPGRGPFPVFMTNHPRVRPWVNTAVRRGYLGVIFYAADASYQGRDDSGPWQKLYPAYDFSLVARWAWGAMRAVDYLYTLPNVRRDQIAISGHSRNSKSALVAAAFDERIGAVASSRGNAGDAFPFRYNTAPFVSEPLEDITDPLSTWFHPRLRFFVGNEHKLPVDINLLQSLVAPRGLLLSHAYTEHQGNTFAVEQSYRSAKTVYQFLGQPSRIGLYQQPGEHPSSPEDLEVYFDFFDHVFGRKSIRAPEMFVHGYTFEKWKSLSKAAIDPLRFPVRSPGDFLQRDRKPLAANDWPSQRTDILKRLRWMLGDDPARVPFPASANVGSPTWWTSEGYLGDLLPRPAQGMAAGRVAFGDALVGEFYYPQGNTGTREAQTKGEKWPVVIWLHPYSYSTGYSRYAFWAPLVRAGFAVLTFDQIGFGARSNQAAHFYERYPDWSLLGRMVADTRAAIDAISSLSVVDTSRIYIAGFSLGAQVALTTAALDDRIKAAAVGVGFSPLRLYDRNSGSEGVRHYSHLHGLAPRLGFFAGHENRLPIDFDEILAAIAPRPVFVTAPTLDRYHPVGAVRRAVTEANKVYRLVGVPDGIDLLTPVEFSRMKNELQKPAYDWLAARAGISVPPAPKER